METAPSTQERLQRVRGTTEAPLHDTSPASGGLTKEGLPPAPSAQEHLQRERGKTQSLGVALVGARVPEQRGA